MCTPQSFRPTMRTLPVIGLTRGPQSQVIFRDEKYLPLYTHSSSHTHLLFFLKLSWCQVPPSRLWVCPCKVHRIQCCLTNPPTVSFPPAPWAGFAGTALPTLSRLPSDIVTSVSCQPVPDHDLTCVLFIVLCRSYHSACHMAGAQHWLGVIKMEGVWQTLWTKHPKAFHHFLSLPPFLWGWKRITQFSQPFLQLGVAM